MRSEPSGCGVHHRRRPLRTARRRRRGGPRGRTRWRSRAKRPGWSEATSRSSQARSVGRGVRKGTSTMRLRSLIVADDRRPRALGRGTHDRRRAGDIGFVLPDSAFALWASADRCAATGGGNGGALKACPAEIGFVLPNSAQPRRGGDRGPRIACPRRHRVCSAKVRAAPRRRRRRPRDCGVAAARPGAPGIERLDGGLPPRQRAPLVAVEPHQPGGDVAAAANPSIMICVRTRRMRWMSTCASAMRNAAARRGSLASSPAIRRASVRGLGRERRIGQHRLVQPVTQRVARAPLLAGARARPGAARRIGAVGGVDFFIGAWCCGRMGIHFGIMCGAIACEVSRAPGPSPPLAGESWRGG